MKKRKEKKKKEDGSYWLMIPALLFIGLGVGLLTDKVAGFLLLGLGLGFLLSFLARTKK